MDKLELLKLQEEQDCEELDERELEEKEREKKGPSFKESYENFYDDVKQPYKFVKEDW